LAFRHGFLHVFCIHLDVLGCFQVYPECMWLDLLRESKIFIDIVCLYKIPVVRDTWRFMFIDFILIFTALAP
jgi:hypothetical protein